MVGIALLTFYPGFYPGAENLPRNACLTAAFTCNRCPKGFPGLPWAPDRNEPLASFGGRIQFGGMANHLSGGSQLTSTSNLRKFMATHHLCFEWFPILTACFHGVFSPSHEPRVDFAGNRVPLWESGTFTFGPTLSSMSRAGGKMGQRVMVWHKATIITRLWLKIKELGLHRF